MNWQSVGYTLLYSMFCVSFHSDAIDRYSMRSIRSNMSDIRLICRNYFSSSKQKLLSLFSLKFEDNLMLTESTMAIKRIDSGKRFVDTACNLVVRR